MMTKKPNLRVNIGGIEINNPVMTASGTFGYASEFVELVDLNRLGAIVVKGLSLEPSRGNPPPRIVETPCGMLNAIGLENVGLTAFVKKKLPFLNSLDTPVFVNIYGRRNEEYAELAARLEDIDGVSGIEVNISCPNVKSGGMAFGAGIVAARRFGAAELVDPRPYAVGSILEVYRQYPDTGPLLPAMGYGEAQVAELEGTVTELENNLESLEG